MTETAKTEDGPRTAGVLRSQRTRSAVVEGERGGRGESSEAGDEYLSPGDVARLLFVSARTVSRWADQGRIPHLVTLGGHRRFRRSDVVKLLGSRGAAREVAPK